MNDNAIIGIMGLGRPCENCGGTGTVRRNGYTVHCPECGGDGFYDTAHERRLADSEPEYPDLEPDFNEIERQETARLDAIEDERELKEYRAEHGDDAPDPQPVITQIPTDDDGNPIYTKQPRRSFYNEDYDPYARVHDLQAQLAAVTAERDTARRTQDQLRDELTAVTAERDALLLALGVESVRDGLDMIKAKDARIVGVTTERDKLREAATHAMNFIDRLGENSPIVFGGEADIYHNLRAALGFDTE